MWISPKFKLLLIKEFERLKSEEQKQIGWNAKRELSKINYRIHTDAIKQNLVPTELTKEQINYIYSEEMRYLSQIKECLDYQKVLSFTSKTFNQYKKEKENKEQYLELFLEADPSEEMIRKYLYNGELFVLTYKDESVCVAVIIKIDNDTV